MLTWLAFAVRRGIVAAYCEWGVTCIIASYAEENEGRPPSNWDDLIGYEYHTHYLPTPRTIDYASSHLSVDFQALSDFHSGRIDQLPVDVIRPTRGLTAHWINPKAQLERYFLDGEVPHGSFNREYADRLRYYAETFPVD
ncbi:hypothetical protein [Rhodopirellula baltica]|uniref:Uncharacterized protein n=1 Tax=Rhodopirellula baltica SWK14 TaxID=993516 RepID=L7CB81_RHOBT|nr:hypothetical protein [Rhodopirellula baltica]ELP31080.1 hypothetical protein RBSWK_04988 [Rhodopirellula baltica SWK14]